MDLPDHTLLLEHKEPICVKLNYGPLAITSCDLCNLRLRFRSRDKFSLMWFFETSYQILKTVIQCLESETTSQKEIENLLILNMQADKNSKIQFFPRI